MPKNTKNVILLFSDLKNGGGVTFTEKISILKNKFNFYLFTLKNKKDTKKLAERLGIKLISPLNFLKWFGPSTVVIANSQLTSLISIILFPCRNFYITHGIGNALTYISLLRKICWIIQINWPGTKVIGCGKTEYKNIKKYQYNKKNSLQINNGIEYSPTLIFSSKKISKQHFCFIGRISKQKGIDLILGALLKRKDDIDFTIIGNIENLKIYEKQKIQRIKKETKIKLHLENYQKISSETFSRFSALIIPSRFEGLPYILLEAINHGIPIITSDCDGIYEVTKKSNLVFKTGDADSLNNSINKYLKMTSHEIQSHSNQLKIIAQKKYNLERFLSKYENIITKTK
jgi:glycosyltransferase involved in cell wall biosynthesis